LILDCIASDSVILAWLKRRIFGLALRDKYRALQESCFSVALDLWLTVELARLVVRQFSDCWCFDRNLARPITRRSQWLWLLSCLEWLDIVTVFIQRCALLVDKDKRVEQVLRFGTEANPEHRYWGGVIFDVSCCAYYLNIAIRLVIRVLWS